MATRKPVGRNSRSSQCNILFCYCCWCFFILRNFGFVGDKNPLQSSHQKFNNARVEYTDHARCRMDCRHITETQIAEVLEQGKINVKKSEPNATPCPKYALEDHVDGKNIRIIIGDCKTEVTIITVIDLDTDFACDCK